ncbi:MAG TPA: GntR family transcriptional regulator [Gemmatimonadaceae bacterium]|nr:GntR family transcriptional regulator [Gemmatimonadaceae bacterium]HWJ22772.1 GntR family transcriptional regulator [Gemmatimonadaceae bacterium]
MTTTPRRPAAKAGAGPAVIPIPRQTIAGMAVSMLRDRILHGAYPAGEPLRQDAIAEELGVSRIPVREALRQLEAEGLVTFNPHRGAVVSSLSLADIEEVFALRADIECDLLRRAMPRLGDEHVRRAREILDAYDRALRGREVAAWGALNWQFHASLYAPAERPITLGIVQRLHQQSDRYARMQLALTHGESRASEEHRAILAAVVKRDAKRAAALMKQHILGAGRSLLDFLEAERGGAGTGAAATGARRRRNGGGRA